MKEMLTLLKRCKEKDGKEEKSEEHGQNGDEIVTPADPAACLDTFTQFLQLSHFTRNLWLGLVPSLGGIAIGTVRIFIVFFLNCDLSIRVPSSSSFVSSANKVGAPSLKS